jgi:hypothetical protein
MHFNQNDKHFCQLEPAFFNLDQILVLQISANSFEAIFRVGSQLVVCVQMLPVSPILVL